MCYTNSNPNCSPNPNSNPKSSNFYLRGTKFGYEKLKWYPFIKSPSIYQQEIIVLNDTSCSSYVGVDV